MRRLEALWAVAEYLFVRFVWARLAWGLSVWLPARAIIEDFAGDAPAPGPRVALFAHFDASGEVRPHVAAYLAALRDAGYGVVLVSNAGRLTAAARATLAPLCARVLVRCNVGYDFGAWADAIAHGAVPAGTDRLLLANDSVYGPVLPLGPVLCAMEAAGADLCGLTESWQARYHLQSFCLLAGRALIHSPEWAAFWAQVRPVPSKTVIILRYEIGLTQAVIRAGFSVRATYRYDELLARAATRPAPPDEEEEEEDPAELARGKQRQRILASAARRTPLNPTSDLWRELLAAGFPFVKRELLRDNPTEVHDVADLMPGLRACGADADLIERDLRRVLRRTAP